MSKQTKLKLRRGFVKAPLAYQVLAVNQMSKEDLKLVMKTLVRINTDADAQKLVGIGSKWGYKPLAYQTDRVGVITYKGVEVAVMYKRVTLTITPLPQDPVPEGKLENADDVWVRFDIFGKSARQQHQEVRGLLDAAEAEARLAQMEIDARDIMLANKDKHIKSLLAKSLKEALTDKMVQELITSTILTHQKELQPATARKKKK